MQTKQLLNKPEYAFRPSQILRRIFRRRPSEENMFAEVQLPWGSKIRFYPQDVIGASIWRMGIYDLPICETIWRLLDPGEYALDVGANIGHMTSLMAVRVGKTGFVLSLEPHPEIYEELSFNMRRWQAQPNIAHLSALSLALSSQSGVANLIIPTGFRNNRGLASLIEGQNGTTSHTFSVKTARLDDVIDNGRVIGLMKIDVEGHELAVLEGGRQHFEQGLVRDIVFEEHSPYPTRVTELLETFGYTILAIHKSFFKAILMPPTTPINSYEPSNYLATRDPLRAKARMQQTGWAVLKAKQ